MTGPLAVAPEQDPEPLYSNEVEFFDLRLAPLFARPIRAIWCVKWQEHEEAADTVKLLWQTWELASMRHSPDDLVVWKRDFAYPLLFDRLCTEDGTFSGCNWREGHHDPDAIVPLGRSQT